VLESEGKGSNRATVVMKAAPSDRGSVEVLRPGNDGETALSPLDGAYIPTAPAGAGPFSSRLSEQYCGAVAAQQAGKKSPTESGKLCVAQ
jgi:hypothetical protein